LRRRGFALRADPLRRVADGDDRYDYEGDLLEGVHLRARA